MEAAEALVKFCNRTVRNNLRFLQVTPAEKALYNVFRRWIYNIQEAKRDFL
jgi:hypothetical protein